VEKEIHSAKLSGAKTMSDPNQILRSARRILLVDWANRGVPRTLVEAGFTVFCASPGRYSVVEVVPEPPEGIDSGDVFPAQEGENGYLVFRRLDDRPSIVDIVNVYRPEKEHAGIVATHVVQLGAKVLWLQPSVGSGAARQLAVDHGLDLVEGIDIALEACQLSK
jgi:predicted CoA-binding protein